MIRSTDSLFLGDMFTIRPDVPFRLEIIIDNQDAAECPENPYTLNAIVSAPGGEEEALTFDGEGAIIDGDVPAQLRMLADMIQQGRVER